MELTERVIKQKAKEYDLQCVKFLDISSGGFTDATCASRCLNLVELSAANNQLSSLDGFGALRHLRLLNVSFNCLKGIGDLKGCVSLETLELQGNQIADSGGLVQLPKLRSLVLSDSKGSNS